MQQGKKIRTLFQKKWFIKKFAQVAIATRTLNSSDGGKWLTTTPKFDIILAI